MKVVSNPPSCYHGMKPTLEGRMKPFLTTLTVMIAIGSTTFPDIEAPSFRPSTFVATKHSKKKKKRKETVEENAPSTPTPTIEKTDPV